MDRVVIKKSRRQAALVLLACLGFVGGGIFILAKDGPALEAWGCIGFFGAGVLVALWQLVDNRPRLIINRRGIWDRTLGVGLIPWSEIEGAYVRSIEGNHFICLLLRDPERFAQHSSALRRFMAFANQALGFTDFSINLCGVNVRAEELLELVLKESELARWS